MERQLRGPNASDAELMISDHADEDFVAVCKAIGRRAHR